MNDIPKHWRIPVIVVGLMMFIGAGLSVTTAIMSLWRTSVPTATYNVFEYLGGPVCPGDTITVATILSTYNAYPTLVIEYETWIDASSGETIIPDEYPDNIILMGPTHTESPTLVRIPLALLPGRYLYRRAVQDDGAPLVAVSIPITIERCE